MYYITKHMKGFLFVLFIFFFSNHFVVWERIWYLEKPLLILYQIIVTCILALTGFFKHGRFVRITQSQHSCFSLDKRTSCFLLPFFHQKPGWSNDALCMKHKNRGFLTLYYVSISHKSFCKTVNHFTHFKLKHKIFKCLKSFR